MAELTVAQRAAKIKMLVLDIDGVLTDSLVVIGPNGSEFKNFCVRDGLGIKLMEHFGISTALISGRSSESNRSRAKELAIKDLYEGILHKAPAFEKVLEDNGLKPEEAAFMGDDLIDLPAMELAGLALAPADAVLEAREAAHWVCSAKGGRGAVREACDLLLKSQGFWEDAVKVYF